MKREGVSAERRSTVFRQLYPPVPGRPIQNAIREKFCNAWDGFLDSCTLPEGTQTFGIDRVLREFYATKWGELLGWIVPNPVDMRALVNQWNEEAQKLRAHKEFPWLRLLLADLGYGDLSEVRERRGPPVRRRQEAILALELHLNDKNKWKWSELARRFCSCSDEERAGDDHNRKCQDRLYREVGHLKRFLKRVRIPLPQ